MIPTDPTAAAAGCAATLLMVLWPWPLLLTGLRALPPGPDHGPAGYDALILATGWWALQLGLGLAVGFAGLLQPWMLMGAQAAFLLAGLGLWLRPGARASAAELPWAWPRRPDGAEGAVLFVLLMFAVLLGLQMLRSPTLNFDSLTYHLPVMAHWVQKGGLDGFAALGHVGMYPSHFELMSTLFFLPWGHDLLIGLPGLIAWGYAGLALYVLWRLWGVRAAAALATVALFLVTPDMLNRIDAVQPDIAVVGFWAACAAGTMRWLRTGAARDLALAILAAGVLLGLKLSAPVHLLVLAVPASWAAWKGRRQRQPLGGAGRPWLIAAAALALFTGAGWYARNLVQTGNPAGLVEVQVAGRTLFEGSLSRAELARGSLARVFRWGEGADWSVLGGVLWRGHGPGGMALLLLAGAGLAAGLRRGSRTRWVVLVLLLAAAEAVLYWFAPYSADNGGNGYRLSPWMDTGLRYGYLVAGLLTGAAAVGLQTFHRRAPLAGLALVTGVGLWSGAGLAPEHAVLFWVSVVLALGGVAWIMLRGRPSGPLPVVAAVSAAVLALGVIGAVWLPGREAARADLYGPVYQALLDKKGLDGVAVVNSQELIRYTGPNWRRPVTVSGPAAGQTIEAWLKGLRAGGCRWLVLGTATGPGAEPQAARIKAALEAPGAPVTRVMAEEDLRNDERLYRIEGK